MVATEVTRMEENRAGLLPAEHSLLIRAMYDILLSLAVHEGQSKLWATDPDAAAPGQRSTARRAPSFLAPRRVWQIKVDPIALAVLPLQYYQHLPKARHGHLANGWAVGSTSRTGCLVRRKHRGGEEEVRMVHKLSKWEQEEWQEGHYLTSESRLKKALWDLAEETEKGSFCHWLIRKCLHWRSAWEKCMVMSGQDKKQLWRVAQSIVQCTTIFV